MADLTPRMKRALRTLLTGPSEAIGRPTKQRLAKHGLAEFLTPKDWDGPVRITAKGKRAIDG